MKLVPENPMEEKCLQTHDMAGYVMVPIDGSNHVVAGWQGPFVHFCKQYDEQSIESHARRVGSLAAMFGNSYRSMIEKAGGPRFNEEQWMATFVTEVTKAAGTIYEKK